MNRFRYWLQNVMSGRYGVDNLNRFLLYVSLILFLLEMLFVRWVDFFIVFYPIALVLLAICYFRMFSRNLAKRNMENQKFLEIRDNILRRGDRTHRIFHCTNCGQKVRVPRGKGRISIRCPKCGREFIKRT